jgi:hypothetical protein
MYKSILSTIFISFNIFVLFAVSYYSKVNSLFCLKDSHCNQVELNVNTCEHFYCVNKDAALEKMVPNPKIEPLETYEEFLQLPLPKTNFDAASKDKIPCMLASYQNKHLSVSQLKYYEIDEKQSVLDDIKNKYDQAFDHCKTKENEKPKDSKLSEDEIILYCTKTTINTCLMADAMEEN